MPPPNPASLIDPLLQSLQQSVAANPAAAGTPAAVLTAVLDEGIAFAHERFRVDSQTRIMCLWNQDGSAGPPPSGLFGTELFAPNINQAVANAGQDEDQVYRTLGELSFANPDYKAIAHRRSHGTHVLDLAAGADPDPATAPRKRPIIAVQMPEQAIADTSGTTLTPYKLLGFIYTLIRAEQLAALLGGNIPVVISLSYGTYEGAHDGSGVLEEMIDELTKLCADSTTHARFVIAAGNHRQARVHAAFEIAPRRPKKLDWRLQPDDRTQNLLQIWLQKSPPNTLNEVEVMVKPPRGASITVNPTKPWDSHSGPLGTEYSAYYVPETPSQRAHVDIYTVATAPAIPLDRTQGTVPAGVWLVKVTHRAGKPFTCDAYIQRGDTLVGRKAMGRQSYFDEPDYARHERLEVPGKQSGKLKDFDRPPPTSDVKRVGTLNGDGTGTESYVIGAYRRTPKPWKTVAASGNPMPTSFTSEGPYAANARRTMPSPNWLMPADDSLSCRGVLGAGTRSGVRVAMSGTSVAAPQAARYVADQFELGNLPGALPPPGLFAVSAEVPASDRPLVGGWGCMDFPPSQTRGRP